MQNKNRRIEREKGNEIRPPYGFQNSEVLSLSSLLLPWSLKYLFKIKIKINIQRYLERYKLFDKYSWLIIYDIIK